MSFIKIENLSKTYIDRRGEKYSAFTVMEDLNLEFEEGEMVCLIGPSGCGKSSLLRMIAGFDFPSSGRISVNGRDVTGPSANNIFVFQHSGLLPWLTVNANVELGLRHMPDEKEKNAKIDEYIELVELDGFGEHFPHQLSGGMQRRAELARALAVNPELLIMDEPFTGLDYFTHLRMREEVVNMHQYLRKTTVMVTHFVDDALVMGDRIVVFGERPMTIKMQRKLDFPRPRNLDKSEEMAKLKDEIFLTLGVSYVA